MQIASLTAKVVPLFSPKNLDRETETIDTYVLKFLAQDIKKLKTDDNNPDLPPENFVPLAKRQRLTFLTERIMRCWQAL